MSLLTVENLEKSFGGLKAVDRVNFDVNKGEIFGLIGPNGSGKTTIFNLISGYFKPTSGAVWFNGQRIDGLKAHKICRLGMARTFQVVKPLKRMSVLENVTTSAFCRTRTIGDAQRLALETIEFCGLMHTQGHLSKELTLEDRKRLEIARALATQPKLLLLDETFAGLNPKELDASIRLVKDIRDKGITIIIIEHIMKIIMNISDRIHAINFGRTLTEGSPEEVAKNKSVIAAYLGSSYA